MYLAMAIAEASELVVPPCIVSPIELHNMCKRMDIEEWLHKYEEHLSSIYRSVIEIWG